MTQYVINIGAVPNDGTGDPLRTAFNETNLNFDQIFAAGPVLSNIRIVNNTILTTNTNGNLVLAPNGTGVVQSNVSIVPNLANLRNLGSATKRWNTVYAQYLNATQLNLTGNLTVSGNLTVRGNTIQVGNIVTDVSTIQLANTATTADDADGAGITVGANNDIATLLYNAAGNVWAMNIGLSTRNVVVNHISSDDSTFVTVQDGLNVQGDITAETVSAVGNISGDYFIGNGSQLTGLPATYVGNTPPVSSVPGSLWYSTDDGRTYIDNGNVWVDASPLVIPPPSTYLGNLSVVNDAIVYSNGQNILSSVTSTSNIAPDNKYSIWYNTDDGRTYINNGNVWVDSSPLVIPPPSTYLGNLSVVNDAIVYSNGQNILTSVSSVSNTTPDNKYSLWYNTDDGRTYINNGNVWVDASPLVIPPPSTYLGNLSVVNDAIEYSNGQNILGGFIFVVSVPTTSKGQSGDLKGMMVLDENYIYYCANDYTNGSDNIWRRTAQTGGLW